MNHSSFRLLAALFVVLVTAIAPAAAQETGAAANGQACVAIVMPSASGVDGDATEFSTSLRDLFASYLTGPSLRAINLEARLASQAIEEAKGKECDYVLLTTITRKRHDGSGWGRALGQAAGTAAYYGVPYGAGVAGAAARGAAVGGAHAISAMATTTQPKDEVTLGFRIGTVATVTNMKANIEKAKAKTSGEDLLTPLVEKAAESIAAFIANNKK